MRINVIGGSGFIGTRLVGRLLANGYDVSIIDKAMSLRFPERTRIADVRDEASLEAAIDEGAVIINLAAEHRDDVTPIGLYEEAQALRAHCEARLSAAEARIAQLQLDAEGRPVWGLEHAHGAVDEGFAPLRPSRRNVVGRVAIAMDFLIR